MLWRQIKLIKINTFKLYYPTIARGAPVGMLLLRLYRFNFIFGIVNSCFINRWILKKLFSLAETIFPIYNTLCKCCKPTRNFSPDSNSKMNNWHSKPWINFNSLKNINFISRILIFSCSWHLILQYIHGRL